MEDRVVGRAAAAPSLKLPPLDVPQVRANVLDDLARRTRRHTSVPVELPIGTTVLLWLILLGDASLLTWLVAVRSGSAPCAGFPCAVATFGDNPVVLLPVTAACVLAMVGVAPVSRGLSRANAPQLALLVVAGTIGAGVLLGVVALAVMVVIGAAFLFLVVAAVAAALDR